MREKQMPLLIENGGTSCKTSGDVGGAECLLRQLQFCVTSQQDKRQSRDVKTNHRRKHVRLHSIDLPRWRLRHSIDFAIDNQPQHNSDHYWRRYTNPDYRLRHRINYNSDSHVSDSFHPLRRFQQIDAVPLIQASAVSYDRDRIWSLISFFPSRFASDPSRESIYFPGCTVPPHALSSVEYWCHRPNGSYRQPNPQCIIASSPSSHFTSVHPQVQCLHYHQESCTRHPGPSPIVFWRRYNRLRSLSSE